MILAAIEILYVTGNLVSKVGALGDLKQIEAILQKLKD